MIPRYLSGIFILGTSIWLFASCTSSEPVHSEPSVLTAQLDSLFQQLHDQGAFNGTAYVRDSLGEEYTVALGIRSLVPLDSLRTETPFYIGSLAKQFTAFGIMLLEAENRLSLQDPVRKFFPELPAFMDSVSVRHLLTHTSGIPDYYDAGIFKPGFSNQQVLTFARELDSLEFKPGEAFSYSNTAYVLLSLILEKSSGYSFHQFMAQRIFTPLGMNHSQVWDSLHTQIPHRAVGYAPDSTLDDYQAFTTGGGGIFSTVGDLAIWEKALNDERLLPHAQMARAYQPTKLDNDTMSYYGYGWMIASNNSNWVYHSGSLAGFRAYLFRDLGNGVAIILLSNFTQDMAEVHNAVMNLLYSPQ